MKFKFRHFAFLICYCICVLIVFISFTCSSTYEKEKDIHLTPIREAEKPVEYEDPVSTVIDISEHIANIDTLENPTEFEGSMVLPIIKKEQEQKQEQKQEKEQEQELEIDIPNIEKKYKDEIPYIARTVWGEARG